ncbi:hypothetical protein ACFPT7_23330 [Acidicapsa dinghuensis]|uniref:Uncharacterized protein n=1 Tax=Acidicapsa dinghuensis TaxID=2218256 RepID=A0ABW1EPP8_9BACT|nr:hypothetical protein [Acidicapsa dinghuensis]
MLSSRTYEPPEQPDHPRHRPPGHPQKHLVRYTKDILSSVIQESGFRTMPLDYCTPDGQHIQRVPGSLSSEYFQIVECADWPIVSNTNYIMRVPSLIIDGIKDR